MNELSDISRQIRERRKDLGLSLSQLARRADTSPATISRYENGWSRFEVATLRKLATALDCDLVVKLRPRRHDTTQVSVDEVVEQIRRLFWDQPLTHDHLEEHRLWVVERVLEFGNLADLRLLTALMGRAAFLRHVSEARFSSDRTRVFWHHMLEREGLTCMRRFSREEAATSWRSSNG